MANTRMAGDALKDPNFAAREKLSNDPEQAKARASKVGSEYDVSGYSEKEISMALQGDSFGAEDYARLTGKSLEEDTPAPEPEKQPEVSAPTPTPGPEAKPEKEPYVPPAPSFQGIGGGFPVGGQNIKQDNDITSNVTGDNNEVTNTQDNSINKFGAYGSADRAKMLRDRYVADVSRFAGVS